MAFSTGCREYPVIDCKNNLYSVSISGRVVSKVIEILYKNSSEEFRLLRKFNKSKEILEKLSVPYKSREGLHFLVSGIYTKRLKSGKIVYSVRVNRNKQNYYLGTFHDLDKALGMQKDFSDLYDWLSNS